MAHEFSEVSFGLNELLVMRHLISGSYTGTVVNMATDQMLGIEPQADTDTLRDSGAITRALAVTTSANFTLGMGAMDTEAIAVMTGSASTSSGTTPNRVATMKHLAGGSGLPYFGLIGVAPTDDGGVLVVGLKACKLNAIPAMEWSGTENKFHVSETEGVAIADTNNLFMVVKRYETAADWTAAKPANAAQFLAFFA